MRDPLPVMRVVQMLMPAFFHHDAWASEAVIRAYEQRPFVVIGFVRPPRDRDLPARQNRKRSTPSGESLASAFGKRPKWTRVRALGQGHATGFASTSVGERLQRELRRKAEGRVLEW